MVIKIALVLAAAAAAAKPPCKLQPPWVWRLLERTERVDGDDLRTVERLVATTAPFAAEQRQSADAGILDQALLTDVLDPADACRLHPLTQAPAAAAPMNETAVDPVKDEDKKGASTLTVGALYAYPVQDAAAEHPSLLQDSLRAADYATAHLVV